MGVQQQQNGNGHKKKPRRRTNWRSVMAAFAEPIWDHVQDPDLFDPDSAHSDAVDLSEEGLLSRAVRTPLYSRHDRDEASELEYALAFA